MKTYQLFFIKTVNFYNNYTH